MGSRTAWWLSLINCIEYLKHATSVHPMCSHAHRRIYEVLKVMDTLTRLRESLYNVYRTWNNLVHFKYNFACQLYLGKSRKIKGMKYWCILRCGRTSNTLCWVREARQKRSHGIWFHPCELSNSVSPEIEHKVMVARAPREEGRWRNCWTHRGLLRSDGHVLEPHRDGGCTTLWMY